MRIPAKPCHEGAVLWQMAKTALHFTWYSYSPPRSPPAPAPPCWPMHKNTAPRENKQTARRRGARSGGRSHNSLQGGHCRRGGGAGPGNNFISAKASLTQFNASKNSRGCNELHHLHLSSFACPLCVEASGIIIQKLHSLLSWQEIICSYFDLFQRNLERKTNKYIK